MGRGRQVSYVKLRSHHRELGVPWTDSSFPATDSSIGMKKVRRGKAVRSSQTVKYYSAENWAG